MLIPPKGFYIHYKHHPTEAVYNYMYEVVGIGRDTEDEHCTVLYRPVYEENHLGSTEVWSRPLELFIDDVEKDGVMVPHFMMITDPVLIAELEMVIHKMYL